jgi:hypothetical protein
VRGEEKEVRKQGDKDAGGKDRFELRSPAAAGGNREASKQTLKRLLEDGYLFSAGFAGVKYRS